MKGLVPRITQLQGFGIREIMTLAFQKPSVIRLEVGEPDFDTPEHIVEAGCRALKGGMTKYIPNMGLPPLRRAVARFFESTTGVPTSPEQILVTHGTLYLLIDIEPTGMTGREFALKLIEEKTPPSHRDRHSVRYRSTSSASRSPPVSRASGPG